MKRCIVMLLLTVIFALPITAEAAPLPVSKVPGSSSVVILEEGDTQLISYTAYLTIQSEDTKVNTTIVIKNNSPDTEANLMIGMPVDLDQSSIKVSNLEVTIDGRKQYLKTRKNRTKPEDTTIEDMPANLSAWTVKINPNEHKVIDTSYTIENPIEPNGTKSLFIPLEYLKVWQGPIVNIKITVDPGLSAPYIFEPNPSVLPHSYDDTGRLTWVYSNMETPNYIRLYYRPIEYITTEYLKAQAPSDRTIKDIIKAYLDKSYEAVISGIDQYLVAQSETTLKNELLFLKALSFKELYQLDETIAIYDQLENQPLFGDLEGTIKNKIIYDKYNYMKNTSDNDAALFEYLDQSKIYVISNTMFLNWIESELGILTPPPTPEPTPIIEEEPPIVEPKPELDEKLVKNVTIAGVDIPVEILFLGIVVLIILFSLLFRKKKKKKNRGYLFR